MISWNHHLQARALYLEFSPSRGIRSASMQCTLSPLVQVQQHALANHLYSIIQTAFATDNKCTGTGDSTSTHWWHPWAEPLCKLTVPQSADLCCYISLVSCRRPATCGTDIKGVCRCSPILASPSVHCAQGSQMLTACFKPSA